MQSLNHQRPIALTAASTVVAFVKKMLFEEILSLVSDTIGAFY
jgi:hypothetical protein